MACCARGAGLRGREGDRCEDCRTWEEDLYWKRFQPLHFCQILGSDVEFRKQLMIPRKFGNNARSIIPSQVTLRGPSSVSWSVTVTTKGEDVLLSDGWEEFVKAYSLQTTNILVFKYDGVSVFDVLIFDGKNLCERESLYFVKRCELKNTSTERQRKRLSSEVETEENGAVHTDKATKQAVEEVGKNVEDLSPRKFRNTKSRARSNAKKQKLVQSKAAASKASSGKKAPASSENLPNSFAILAELGKSIVENATSALEPESPIEINVDHAPETPYQNNVPQFNGGFSTEAPDRDTTQINGGWMVESPPRDTPQINGSFSAEATQSRKETNGKKKVTQNTVSPKGKHKKGVSSSGRKNASASDVRIQNKNSTKKVTSENGLDLLIGATEGADDVAIESPESATKKFVSEEGKMALEMARKEMTESSFAVVMRPTCVYKRFQLTVPPAFHQKHLAPKSQDVFLRIGEKTWLTKLGYSTAKATGQICGGWKQFVQANKLEEFDVCLFSLASQNEDSAMLDVSIFRAVRAEAVPLRQLRADSPIDITNWVRE